MNEERENPDDTFEQHDPVNILIGKKNEGWEQFVREKGFDPGNGYTSLEKDGFFHWHEWPKDPREKERIMQEIEIWDADS
jgi:hypothetical protein